MQEQAEIKRVFVLNTPNSYPLQPQNTGFTEGSVLHCYKDYLLFEENITICFNYTPQTAYIHRKNVACDWAFVSPSFSVYRFWPERNKEEQEKEGTMSNLDKSVSVLN